MTWVRDALEGKTPQRRPEERINQRLEEVAKAAGGGYCRLQMPLGLALGVRETVAGRPGGGGGGGNLPPFQCIPDVGVAFATSRLWSRHSTLIMGLRGGGASLVWFGLVSTRPAPSCNAPHARPKAWGADISDGGTHPQAHVLPPPWAVCPVPVRARGGGGGPGKSGGAAFKKPDFFGSGQPLRTAPRDYQPPTANRHQPPTANRHQPPTANRPL